MSDPRTPNITLQLDDTTEQVYAFVCAYMTEHGYAPSIREIASGCFISRGMVTRHLDRLQIAGRLTRQAGKARSIRLLAGNDTE